MAHVKLRGPLKRLAGDSGQLTVDGETVAAVLLALERDQPALRGWILDERGAVRRHINVFVSGDYATGETAVGPADRIDVLPAISGG